MNVFSTHKMRYGKTFAALTFSVLVAAACATVPSSPDGASELRNKLTVLQNDPNLADRAKATTRYAEDQRARFAE